MSKKLSQKDMEKLERQMGITKVKHDRPPVGRPVVFQGTTNKQKRRAEKKAIHDYIWQPFLIFFLKFRVTETVYMVMNCSVTSDSGSYRKLTTDF